MSTRTHRIFLLRAYGDATIALHFLANSPEKNNYEVIASSHLKPLIDALRNFIDLSSLKIEFVDFGITKSQLNLFTNRHLISTNTLQQVIKLKQFIKNNPNYHGLDYLEQDKKSTLLNLLTGHSFKTIVDKQVYAKIGAFFNANIIIPTLTGTINKILILPDARITARRIPENVIEHIKTPLKGANKSLQVAYLNKENEPLIQTDSQNALGSYSNFEKLLALINEADFIFGSDSLPIHLCHVLKKPHFILYPYNGSDNFFTPYALQNKYYLNFKKVNENSFNFLSKL
jgi:ADP-heptose:LPS heptosyltransferase